MGCKLFKLGNTTGFICGAKPDHVCNSDGPGFAILCSGEHILESKVTDEMDVCGGCVSCSICGEPFTPPIF